MSIFNNNRWIKISILLLLAGNICTLFLLWTKDRPAHGQQERRPGGPFEFISNELKLTPEQKAAYAQLRDEHRAGARLLEDSIRTAKDGFFALLRDKAVSDSTLKKYSNNITEKEAALDLLTFRHFQQLRMLCDAGQQQRFDAIIQEAIRGMRGRPPGPLPHP